MNLCCLCHHETHRARADHGEEESICIGNMVYHQQGSTTHGQTLQVNGARTIHQLQAPDADHADEFLGNQAQRADEDEEAHHKQHEELLLGRSAENLVHDPHERHGYKPHQVVDEIAGSDDVASVVGVTVVLQEGIEWYQVGSAECAGERQQDVAGVGVYIEEGEQQGACRDADRAEGNEPQLILALAKLRGHCAAEHHAAGHPGHQDTALQ